MTKAELLLELREETYVSLKSSSVHGVGVFAILYIPKGCQTIFSKRKVEWIKLSFEEVEQLPVHSRALIEIYYLYDNDGYFIPEFGCKIMEMVSYLNHSNTPNIESDNDGEIFKALRDIKVGEELFIDYTKIAQGLNDYQ